MREHLKETDAGGIIASLGTILPDVDRALLTGELGADMAGSFAEALRAGVEGWLEDDPAFTRPWGFELAVRTPSAGLLRHQAHHRGTFLMLS